MDLVGLISFIALVIAMVIGMIVSVGYDMKQMRVFWDTPSLFITGVCSICALILGTEWGIMKNVFKVFGYAFRARPVSYSALIDDFRRYAEIARKEGVLALDNIAAGVKDPFMSRAIQLAVDGVDPSIIEQLLTLEAEQMSGRHADGINTLKRWAGYAPSFGMIGTLVGLVIMLKNLSDPAMIGPSMAVAILTTLYGAWIAYIICIPLADRLDIKNNQELLEKQLIIKGIISIQSGDNPRMVVQKLKLFLPPKLREAGR